MAPILNSSRHQLWPTLEWTRPRSCGEEKSTLNCRRVLVFLTEATTRVILIGDCDLVLLVIYGKKVQWPVGPPGPESAVACWTTWTRKWSGLLDHLDQKVQWPVGPPGPESAVACWTTWTRKCSGLLDHLDQKVQWPVGPSGQRGARVGSVSTITSDTALPQIWKICNIVGCRRSFQHNFRNSRRTIAGS
ncbi:uncharacterized protein [Procambarus clarkii]|uniref:uncharacterized protein isoform X2 n=1 Tax=Procambarus clarkii TaxID=6728 RepID=UPI0037435E06